ANPFDHLAPILVLGRVHIEEDRVTAGIADRVLDVGDVRQRLAPVQMHSVNTVTGTRQLDRDGLAEAAARPQDQRPFQVTAHRITPTPLPVFGARARSARRTRIEPRPYPPLWPPLHTLECRQ